MTDLAAPIGHNRPPGFGPCGECGEPCPTAKARFCCDAHRFAFHNRMKARGQSLAPLVMAWRMGRGSGGAAKYAFTELCALADRWNAEDRQAGRVGAADFISHKMLAGWKACDL